MSMYSRFSKLAVYVRFCALLEYSVVANGAVLLQAYIEYPSPSRCAPLPQDTCFNDRDTVSDTILGCFPRLYLFQYLTVSGTARLFFVNLLIVTPQKFCLYKSLHIKSKLSAIRILIDFGHRWIRFLLQNNLDRQVWRFVLSTPPLLVYLSSQ